MNIIRIIAVAAVMAVTGCSAGQDTAASKEAVATFRQQFDAGKYADIYNAAAPDLKGSVTEAKFVEMLGAFHDGLGKFQSAPEPGWRFDTSTDGDIVTLNYESTFEKAKAKEDFVFRIVDGKPILAGYNIKTIDGPAPAAAAPANAADGATEGDAAPEGESEGEAEGT